MIYNEDLLHYTPSPKMPVIPRDQLGKRQGIGSMIKDDDMHRLVEDIKAGKWQGSLDLGGMSVDEFVRRVEAGQYD